MNFKESPSGMLYPEQNPEQPPRQYKLLELTNDADRKEFASMFSRMLNSGLVQGVFVDTLIAKQRKELIMNLAEVLLGDDFNYEELC